jgi:type II secretory pathway pseudopilin PulG
MPIKNKGGFTIIEALVAFAVLTLSLGPLLVVVTMSARISSSIKNNLTASMLAQEGIEVVRAIRDTNWLKVPEDPFYTNLNGGADGSTETGTVQYNSSAIVIVGPSPYLKFDSSSGLYSYDSGSPAPYKRTIKITKIPNPANPGNPCVELKVESVVTWQENNRLRTITVEDHLFDWK